METTTNVIPKKVFIVPYRNRSQQKFFFTTYLSKLLENDDTYEVYFSHQCDVRTFNRGATRNIGFLAVKQKYPNNYKDITFIFNDIDTLPYNNILDYETTHGVVKHFYGFDYALGGMVSIKGADFEATNGYANFWGWGMEDNVFNKRCQRIGLHIDRSHFYKIGSPEILQLFDGVSRLINPKDPWRAQYDNGIDGIRSIHNLMYSIDKESLNPNDNLDIITNDNGRFFVINIKTFLTAIRFESDGYVKYDLREPPRKIINPNKIRSEPIINHNVDDWTNIPHIPSQKQQDDIECMPIPINNATSNSRPISAPHKYSPEYARHVGAKPRATASANIDLGGVKYKTIGRM